jgi:phytoene dehydrogenase-like protein
MSFPCDALIIGGGHNGLVCACYLAEAGLKVRVLERRHIVGGAAVTEEFHPGFRNSVASYTVSLLNPKVIRDLRLAEHGLRIVERPFSNFLPLNTNEGGDSLRVGGGIDATQREVARFSARDAARLPAYYDSIERAAAVLRGTVLQTPPNAGGGLLDAWRALQLGRNIHRLDIETQRDLHALFTKSAGEWLDGWFESDPIKAALGFDAVVGNFATPYTPGSAYVLLHHCFGEVNGKRGIWGHAIGGMGAITQAMAAEARERGVEIETSAAVARVIVRGGRAIGVELEDGRKLTAARIVSNLNPKLLFERLIEPGVLDEDFRRRIAGWKCASGTLRMNVALKELPDFIAAPGTHAQPHHSSGIIMAPSLQYMYRAFRDAQELGWPREPIVELLIPSTVDDSLAPPGMHVASLFCQHFNPNIEGGWDAARERAADAVIDTVNRYAPNFKSAVIARQILTPLDLERTFGLVGGDIFHGALSLDQLYSARPVLGYADYRTPIEGLYQCGSGTHPGGGVTGAPGHNAAREILRDRR